MDTLDKDATNIEPRTGRRYTSVRCALMTLLGLLLPIAAQAFLLGPLVPLADSTLDSDAVTGDFNGDGRDDLAFCLGNLYVTVKLQDEALRRNLWALPALFWLSSIHQEPIELPAGGVERALLRFGDAGVDQRPAFVFDVVEQHRCRRLLA